MGTFIAVSSVIGKAKKEVADSLANYARSVGGGLEQEDNLRAESPNCCIMEEADGNVSVSYPDGFLEWDNSSEFLSKELGAPVFSFHIHDGDLWMYVLYHKGQVADRFNPVPDYWEENLSPEEIKQWKGNAGTIANLIPYIKTGDINRYLVRWDPEDEEPAKAYPTDAYTREDWQLLDFMAKLKLPYPVDDNGNPKGQTFTFWTGQLKQETEQSKRDADRNTDHKKPWWKFW